MRIRIRWMLLIGAIAAAIVFWRVQSTPQQVEDLESLVEDTILESNSSQEPNSMPLPTAFDLERANRARAAYLEFAQYPPNSRPFEEGLREMIDWNAALSETATLGGQGGERALQVLVSLDKMYAAPGEAIQASISVEDPKALDLGVSPTSIDFVARGYIEFEDKSRANQLGSGPLVRIQEIPFGPGRTPNSRVGNFVPSEIQELDAQPLPARFVVEIRHGRDEKSLAIDFRYGGSREPILVYGKLDDEVVDGSLRVLLDAEIRRIGPIKLRAVLYGESEDTPLVTFSEYITPPGTGRQPLTLTFFGKAILDRGVPGPYRVKHIHGIFRDPNANPPEIFWSFPSEINTKKYSLSDFSPALWDSEGKRGKIAMYDSLVEAAEQMHSP